MAIAWPKYVVFQSMSGGMGGKYLRYATEGVTGARPSYIQSSADVAVSPNSAYTKFEIEVASTGNGRLIHIKSCFNNKYWARVSNSTAQPQWLAACADAPDEDSSKWTCTLFEYTGSGTIHLKHVQLNAHVAHYHRANPNCLHLSNSSQQAFSFIDWESLLILPRHVAFKGVDNDRYLGVKVWRRRNYLSLEGTSTGSNGVPQETFNTPDGSSRFKSIDYDRFWRLDSPWIMVDAADSNRTKETMFEVVKVGEDTVAIRSLHSRLFLAKQRNSVYMAADMETPVKSALLKVEEVVVRRNIYNINYRLSDATIYNEEPIVMVSADASNLTTEDGTLTLELTFSKEETRSVNNSVSVDFSVKSSFRAGIPFIKDGKIEISASTNYTHSWGETIPITNSGSQTVDPTVPPGTRVNAHVLATKGTCYVPFSYTQEDVLITGPSPPIIKHDGLYIGANFYNIHTEINEEPLEVVAL